mgnify:CR=1 FL=1
MRKATEILNDTIKRLGLIDIFRTLHPKNQNTFFISAHRSISKIDHILGHKTRLNKFKRTEIISSIFSDYNSMKLEINYRKKNEKNKNISDEISGDR